MIEIKKLKSELSRVIAAKDEMDYLIEQRLQEIQRLKDSMEKQESAEKELKEKLKVLEGSS